MLPDTFLSYLAAKCVRPANGREASTISSSVPSKLTSRGIAVRGTALTVSVEKTRDEKLTENATLLSLSLVEIMSCDKYDLS